MKNSKLKRFIAIVAMIAVLFVMAGCTQPAGNQGQQGQINEGQKVYEVDLTYANLAYIETGDETIDKFTDDVEQTVSVATMDTEEAMLSAAVLEAIELLKTVPDNLDTAVTCVSDSVPVNSATVAGRQCTVDIGAKAMEMDSYTEMFFIYQIADTILDSFEQIDQVIFTVDGQAVDSLGHLDISQPYTDEVVDRFEG